MVTDRSEHLDGRIELERRLRYALDELDAARADAATARADLEALAHRIDQFSPRAEQERDQARAKASEEFLERQRKEVARHDRLMRLARPVRSTWAGPYLERGYRKIRAWRS